MRVNCLENELWKVVPFANDYSVSNFGRIKHTWKNGNEYLLKPYLYNNDVVVKIHDKRHRFPRLIWEVFVGEIPDGHIVVHIDFCQMNNDLTNLKCMPPKENGHRTARFSKLNKPVVCESLGKIYFSARSCAKHLGISYNTVSRYCKNPDCKNNQTLKLRWATEAEVKKYMDIIERKKLRGEYK